MFIIVIRLDCNKQMIKSTRFCNGKVEIDVGLIWEWLSEIVSISTIHVLLSHSALRHIIQTAPSLTRHEGNSPSQNSAILSGKWFTRSLFQMQKVFYGKDPFLLASIKFCCEELVHHLQIAFIDTINLKLGKIALLRLWRLNLSQKVERQMMPKTHEISLPSTASFILTDEIEWCRFIAAILEYFE